MGSGISPIVGIFVGELDFFLGEVESHHLFFEDLLTIDDGQFRGGGGGAGGDSGYFGDIADVGGEEFCGAAGGGGGVGADGGADDDDSGEEFGDGFAGGLGEVGEEVEGFAGRIEGGNDGLEGEDFFLALAEEEEFFVVDADHFIEDEGFVLELGQSDLELSIGTVER